MGKALALQKARVNEKIRTHGPARFPQWIPDRRVLLMANWQGPRQNFMEEFLHIARKLGKLTITKRAINLCAVDWWAFRLTSTIGKNDDIRVDFDVTDFVVFQ